MTPLARQSPLGITRATRGMMKSATRDETIFPKAAPMTTPTARSTTFPLKANDLKSATRDMGSSQGFGVGEGEGGGGGMMVCTGGEDGASSGTGAGVTGAGAG